MASNQNKKSESVRESTFTKWVFSDDFEIVKKNGDVVVEVICKYCPRVSLSEMKIEATYRKIKGSALTALESFRSSIKYIHKPTLERHVGDNKSMHSWSKGKVNAELGLKVPESIPQVHNQPKIDISISNSAFQYYEKLFTSVLYLIEQELPFHKLKSLMDLQMKNGIKFGTTDKINDKACAEIADVIGDVLSDIVKEYMEKSKFMSISCDASEARKTSEEKELVYAKILIKSAKGVFPCMFLLKCQALKDFGGGTARGTFEAVKDAVLLYLDESSFKEKLVCMAMDGASVNFGERSGVIKLMCDYVGWLIFKFHCINHRLELAVKDAYEVESIFKDIKESMDNLYRTFKASGKSWRIYQIIGEELCVKVLRFVRCGGTRFQAHTRNALTSFLRNFLVSLLFAENCEQQGTGKDRIVTKEMYKRFVECRKKWLKYEFVASAKLFFDILNETAHLSLLFESDSMLIYQVKNTIEEILDNLRDLSEDNDYDEMPFNVKVKDARLSGDSVNVTIAALNTNANEIRSLQGMHQVERDEATGKVTIHSDTFTLTDLKSGRKQVERLRKKFIPVIIENVEKRFENLDDFEPLDLFDVSLWSNLSEDSAELAKNDAEKLDKLATLFKTPLELHTFDLREAKKEWKKVKRIVQRQYMHLKEQQVSLWSNFLHSHGTFFQHVSIIIEIFLVMMGSSSVVERGFSTCRRNLPSTRLSMKNRRLNNILSIKINMPCLRKVMKDAEKNLIERATNAYYERKNWRWKLKPIKDDLFQEDSVLAPPPPKRYRLQDITEVSDNDDEDTSDDNESDADED